ncbi:MAG: DUF6212 domain-containing protein [Pseudomonadota bacterium]
MAGAEYDKGAMIMVQLEQDEACLKPIEADGLAPQQPLLLAVPGGRSGLPASAAKTLDDLGDLSVLDADVLEQNHGFTGPAILIANEPKHLPRLLAMPSIASLSPTRFAEGGAAALLEAAQGVVVGYAAALATCQSSLAVLRRRFEHQATVLERFEKVLQSHLPNTPFLVFQNTIGSRELRFPPSAMDVTIRQRLPVSSHNCRVIELSLSGVTAGSPEHSAALIHLGSGQVLSSWTFGRDDVEDDVLRLVCPPPDVAAASDIALVLTLDLEAERSDLVLACGVAHPDERNNVSVGEEKKETPLAMRIYDALPLGEMTVPGRAVHHADNAAEAKRRIGGRDFDAAEFVHPPEFSNHTFDLVAAMPEGGLLVHPVMNGVVCGALRGPDDLNPTSFEFAFRNDHDQNTGIEMAGALLLSSADKMDLHSILASEEGIERYLSKTPWVYLGPGQEARSTLPVVPGSVDSSRIFILSRLPQVEDVNDQHARAVVKSIVARGVRHG